MGSRYLVSGTDLAMIKVMIQHDTYSYLKYIDDIIDKQYICHSDKSINEDIKTIETIMSEKDLNKDLRGD